MLARLRCAVPSDTSFALCDSLSSGCALLCSLAVVGASGAALWLELPAVWRWFAQSAVDLLLLCVSVVGDMPAVDGEAGITKSKAKCALAFFPRAPL